MSQQDRRNKPLVQCKLLVVDDEEKITKLLAQHFSLNGYEVRIAYGGDEALATASEFHPNVVLLDLMMPMTSGVNTLKGLKQLTPTPKVLMVSAIDQEQIIKDVLRLGADHYVCKPINFNELDQLVETLSAAPSAKPPGPGAAADLPETPTAS